MYICRSALTNYRSNYYFVLTSHIEKRLIICLTQIIEIFGKKSIDFHGVRIKPLIMTYEI